MKKFKLNPIRQTLYFLAIYAVTATSYVVVNGEGNFLSLLAIHALSTVGLSGLWYVILSKITGKRKLWEDSLITGLILFLTMHYALDLTPEIGQRMYILYAALATTAAMFLKFFVNWKGSPVINPAIFGMLIAAGLGWAIFEDVVFVSWWGASFGGYLTMGLIALWYIFGLKKWRKWPMVVSFIGVYALLLWVSDLSGWQDISVETLAYIFTDATIYFYAGIMLIEPKTSPIKPSQQMVLGSLAALLMTLYFTQHWAYFNLFSIAIVNVAYAGWKWQTLKPKAPNKMVKV